MNILVVDDEALAREDIARHLAELGYLNVRQASDGLEAFELHEAEPADLIIADIRMPGLDGIGLLNRIRASEREMQLTTYFIIVSGFDSFEYAQQAVRLGAFGYLLKPFDRTELGDLLNSVQERMAYSERQNAARKNLELEARLGLEAKREQVWQELVAHRISSVQALEDRLASLDLQFPDPYCAALILSAEADQSNIPVAASSGLVKRTCIDAWLAQNNLKGYIYWEKNSLFVFFSVPQAYQTDSVLWTELLQQLLTQVIASTDAPFTIGVGQIVSPAGELIHSYRGAMQALNRQFLHGKRKLYLADETQNNGENGKVVLGAEMEKQFRNALNQRDGMLLHRLVTELYDRFLQYDSIQMKDVQKLNLQLILVFANHINQFSTHPDPDWTDEFALYTEVNTCPDIASTKAWFIDKVDGWLASDAEDKTVSTHLVDTALHYINTHLQDGLTLHTVAEHVYLSPNYFSRLFKQKTGENFIDYISRTRLERASVLLHQGQHKVNEIAALVGFNDLRHFYKVFKNYTGFTPREYQRRNLRDG